MIPPQHIDRAFPTSAYIAANRKPDVCRPIPLRKDPQIPGWRYRISKMEFAVIRIDVNIRHKELRTGLKV
jgi:hypothetical protein